MTVKATFTAAFPEARRMSNFLERDFSDSGVVVSLDERVDGLWAVDAYFEHGSRDEIAAQLRDWLGADAFGAPLAVESLPETDWVAAGLASLEPVAAGRFVVHGRHHRDLIPKGRIAIAIEAGQAFGTGHHATTAGVLEVIDRLVAAHRYRRVLDLGSGSGVLAIALAKILHTPVLATDIDPLAVRIARDNAVRNRVGPLVTTIVADGLAHGAIRERAPFDLIVANILAEPLMRLAPAIALALSSGGDLVLSGLLLHQRERVVAAYGTQGIVLRTARATNGWVVLHLRRPAQASRGRRGRVVEGRAGGTAWQRDA